MQYEADNLGADGIIGTELKIEYIHGGEWMEVTAIGTAIKYVGAQAGDTGNARVVLDVSEGTRRRPEIT